MTEEAKKKMSQDKKPREYCHTISDQYRCPRCLLIDLEISTEENAKLKSEVERLKTLLDSIEDSSEKYAVEYAKIEEENAKLKENLRAAEEAHEKIAKVKYGLELSDYDNMEYVADYWAKQCGNYVGISREALRKIRGE